MSDSETNSGNSGVYAAPSEPKRKFRFSFRDLKRKYNKYSFRLSKALDVFKPQKPYSFEVRDMIAFEESDPTADYDFGVVISRKNVRPRMNRYELTWMWRNMGGTNIPESHIVSTLKKNVTDDELDELYKFYEGDLPYEEVTLFKYKDEFERKNANKINKKLNESLH